MPSANAARRAVPKARRVVAFVLLDRPASPVSLQQWTTLKKLLATPCNLFIRQALRENDQCRVHGSALCGRGPAQWQKSGNLMATPSPATAGLFIVLAAVIGPLMAFFPLAL